MDVMISWEEQLKLIEKYNSIYVDRSSMGNELLNDPFPGCEKHHINKYQIVCIPAELHRKYKHDHRKPETMEEVNRIAMKYLFKPKIKP